MLQKKTGKNFIILNLSDIQLNSEEWSDGHQNRKLVTHTIEELIRRTTPDLITISGDIAWGCDEPAYEKVADFIETFQIPWAPVLGNHDNQWGPDSMNRVTEKYMNRKYCLFQKGDPELGIGNYTLSICEKDKKLLFLVLLDSHDKDKYIGEDGKEHEAWAKLTPAQIGWYKEQIAKAKEDGFKDGLLITHIPINAYRTASECAYKKDINLKELTPEASHGVDCWEEGYKDSVGVQYEDISSFPLDDHVFDAVKEAGLTSHIIVGHDHVNNWMITYEGIRLIFSLNTGPGCYWNPILNGGTVFTISDDGIVDVHHEYVDVSELI